MATQNGLNILYLYADTNEEWNCAEWRCHIPANSINAAHQAGLTPHQAKLYYLPTALDWNSPKVQKLLGMYDVFMFQRNVIAPEVWSAMDYWRALGKAVIVDVDDHYGDLPPSNPAHQYWTRNRSGMPMDPVEALTEGMRHADAVTSPSKVLLKDWAHILPGYWIPNYTRRAWYEPVNPKQAGKPDLIFGYRQNENQGIDFVQQERPDSAGCITLGWGGSISHVDSWLYSGIVESLDRIFEKYPNTRLKFCGHETRLDYVFGRWGDRVIKQDGVKPEHWPYVVGSFDIGLAPLDTRPLDPPWRDGAPVISYDERRSWLKAIEYLSAGVPWVASKSATYADLARWGTLADNTPDGWFAALDRMISTLPTRKAEAIDRRRWALRKVTMEGNVHGYCETFGRIIADKLTRGKKNQMPGVAYVGI